MREGWLIWGRDGDRGVGSSLVALGVSGAVSWRQLRLSEKANTLPVVDLFREHRTVRLARARAFAHKELPACDLSLGLAGLPDEGRDLVRELAWYFDNLGALVTHGVVEIERVSGYLGGSVVSVWEHMKPLVRESPPPCPGDSCRAGSGGDTAVTGPAADTPSALPRRTCACRPAAHSPDAPHPLPGLRQPLDESSQGPRGRPHRGAGAAH